MFYETGKECYFTYHLSYNVNYYSVTLFRTLQLVKYGHFMRVRVVSQCTSYRQLLTIYNIYISTVPYIANVFLPALNPSIYQSNHL